MGHACHWLVGLRGTGSPVESSEWLLWEDHCHSNAQPEVPPQ